MAALNGTGRWVWVVSITVNLVSYYTYTVDHKICV